MHANVKLTGHLLDIRIFFFPTIFAAWASQKENIYTLSPSQSGLLKKKGEQRAAKRKRRFGRFACFSTQPHEHKHIVGLIIMTGLPFRARYRSRRAAEQVAHRNLHCYAEQISVPFGASARTLPPSHITLSLSKDILYALFPLMGREQEGTKKKKEKSGNLSNITSCLRETITVEWCTGDINRKYAQERFEGQFH